MTTSGLVVRRPEDVLKTSTSAGCKSEQKLWKILPEEHFLVKLQTLNLQLYRKNVLHCKYFNWFVYILGAFPLKQFSKGKSNNFEIYCMLYCYSFSAVKVRWFEWLTDGKCLIKTKLNC